MIFQNIIEMQIKNMKMMMMMIKMNNNLSNNNHNQSQIGTTITKIRRTG
ncbi:MAG: hypothetical protein ACRD6Q_00970 [Nitrososphaeraceae archaeon]